MNEQSELFNDRPRIIDVPFNEFIAFVARTEREGGYVASYEVKRGYYECEIVWRAQGDRRNLFHRSEIEGLRTPRLFA
jgi:hypothetical protein